MKALIDIESLVRPNVRALKPYTSARDEFKLEPADARPYIFLDANENSWGSPLDEDFSRYPDPRQLSLKMRLAEREQVGPEAIFVGNGSDEAIDLLLRTFCIPEKDNVIILPPTYGMYAVMTHIHGAELRTAPLRPDFSPDPETIRRATDNHSKILFLCSPNNPTGNHLPEKFIQEMLESFPGIVVVDEAYNDFSGRPSLTKRLGEFPNLVVLKTFSKAWGLAGLRVGMAFASPYIISILNNIKYPYNIGAATINLVCHALEKTNEVKEKIRAINSERQRLASALEQLGCIEKIFPGEANFLLVKTIDANKIYQILCDNNIVVRNRSNELHCENCLRITVGAPQENDLLIQALENISKAYAKNTIY